MLYNYYKQETCLHENCCGEMDQWDFRIVLSTCKTVCEGVHPQSPWRCPSADFTNEMKATYKGKEEERMHHIPWTIHLGQIKPSDWYSACINLSEKYYYIPRSFGGVELYIYPNLGPETYN